METIKKILEEIGLAENQINDFQKTHEIEIKDFFKSLLEKQIDKPIENHTAENKQKLSEEIAIVKEISGEILEEKSTESEIKNPLETPPEEIIITSEQTTENQQQTDMKFGSGEKIDKEKAQSEAMAFQIKNKQITFQNGKVGQKYCIDFDFEKLEFAEIAEVSFVGLEKIGLEYCPDEKKIKGLPTEAGDHKITMNFKRKDWTEGKPLLQREVVFIINPDPRVLWNKNIPSEQDATKIDYPKPDSAKDFVKVESKVIKGLFKDKLIARKNIVAASQRGRSHAIEGKPRDDDFALNFDAETEWYTIIVADGAGSAKFSREGSKIACNTAMSICKEKLLARKEEFANNGKAEDKNEVGKLLREIIGSAVFESYKAIEKEATEKGKPIKDFSTTLILSVCKKFEYGWFIGAWWVGDGGIGIYNREKSEIKILGVPDGGEFAGQTRFLTMPDIIKNELYSRMKFEVVEDFTELILMTDGITDPKFETDANLNRIEKWNDLWQDLGGKNEDNIKVDFTYNNEQAADQLLKWLDFWSKGNHDDRTIAILF